MRTSIIIARRHDSEEFELVAGPEVPIHEQIDAYRKALAFSGVHEEYAEIQRWEDGIGMYGKIRLEKAEVRKARAEKVRVENEARIAKEKAEANKDKKTTPATPAPATPAPETPPAVHEQEGEITDL